MAARIMSINNGICNLWSNENAFVPIIKFLAQFTAGKVSGLLSVGFSRAIKSMIKALELCASFKSANS